MTPQTRRTAQRTAVAALLVAAAVGLGGCEQLKAIGDMVGLGSEAPQTAPSPPPRRPRPAATAASPAPGRPGAPVPAPAVATASPALPAPAGQPPKPGAPGRAQPAQGGSPAPVVAAGRPAEPDASITVQPPPAAAAAAPPAPSMPAGGRPARPDVPVQGSVAPAVATAPQLAASPLPVRLPEVAEPFDPAGKRDPFRPYVTSAELAERRSKEQLSPLQRLELSQLRLVAIVWGMRRNHAMVEDSGGVGYVLRVGTKVGPNGGRVARITPDAVYVEESFRDATGSVLTNQITLRLPQKNPGGKGS
jgi:type IV pilus assembly protein PilP